MTRFVKHERTQWLINRAVNNAKAGQPNINPDFVRAFAAGYLLNLEYKDMRLVGQFDIVDAFFDWINTSNPVPAVYLPTATIPE